MYVFNIREDRDGYYWEFASEGGLNRITRSTSYPALETCRLAISILKGQAQNTDVDDPFPP